MPAPLLMMWFPVQVPVEPAIGYAPDSAVIAVMVEQAAVAHEGATAELAYPRLPLRAIRRRLGDPRDRSRLERLIFSAES